MSAHICLIRVDDRLIHGQVTVGWRQHLHFDTICVIDDTLAADPFLADVLRLSAPTGIAVYLSTIPNATNTLNKIKGNRTLVLLKTPQIALKLHQAGLHIQTLNVGNIADAPGRKRVYKSISLGPAEIAALDELTRQNVQIFFQQTPEERAIPWNDIKRQAKLN